MASVKRLTLDYSATALTVYAIIRREVDSYRLDDGTGSFAVSPADPYVSATEDAVIKGRYQIDESRQVWTDGRYTVAFYQQAGGSPAPVSDTIIGSGELVIYSDAEVYSDVLPSSRPTLAGMEASTVLAKQAKLDFVEKWILNKLVESPSGTWTLYDTDDTTPLKVWTWTAGTSTRAKAI